VAGVRGIGHCLIGLALVVVLAVAAPAGAAPRTQRTVYSPFGADGSLRAGLHAVDRDGTCFTSSAVVGRRDVYRCITGNLLRDPCYRDAAASARRSAPVVVCAAAPWNPTLVRITLGTPLPGDPTVPVAGRPWGLELAGGARCVFVSGASELVRGYRLNYVCRDGRVLYGLPRRSSPAWRIREARSATAKAMRFAAIRRAWS
jgi:hypothetical protein